jgi:hypothetical protein
MVAFFLSITAIVSVRGYDAYDNPRPKKTPIVSNRRSCVCVLVINWTLKHWLRPQSPEVLW